MNLWTGAAEGAEPRTATATTTPTFRLRNPDGGRRPDSIVDIPPPICIRLLSNIQQQQQQHQLRAEAHYVLCVAFFILRKTDRAQFRSTEVISTERYQSPCRIYSIAVVISNQFDVLVIPRIVVSCCIREQYAVFVDRVFRSEMSSVSGTEIPLTLRHSVRLIPNRSGSNSSSQEICYRLFIVR